MKYKRNDDGSYTKLPDDGNDVSDESTLNAEEYDGKMRKKYTEQYGVPPSERSGDYNEGQGYKPDAEDPRDFVNAVKNTKTGKNYNYDEDNLYKDKVFVNDQYSKPNAGVTKIQNENTQKFKDDIGGTDFSDNPYVPKLKLKKK